jgi:hypothetical protein
VDPDRPTYRNPMLNEPLIVKCCGLHGHYWVFSILDIQNVDKITAGTWSAGMQHNWKITEV